MATTIVTVNNTTVSTQLVPANSRRSSLRIVINGAIRAFVLQGSGTASSTNRTLTLDEFAQPGVTITPPESREAFQVIFESAGAGSVVATETTPSEVSAGAASYPLLTIIREVCDLLALPRPATVINSNDLQVKQLFALAVEEARELAKSFGWQTLKRECTFTTVDDPEQVSAVPDDLGRFIPNSFFNRTTRRPVVGPVTPQVWQNIQANPALNRVILGYRQRDRAFLITPTPPADQTIAYEYVSTEWAISSDGLTTRTKWAADTDLTYLDAELIILGLRWRWRKTKGLPYAEDFDTYTAQKEQLQARDGGSTSISLTNVPVFALGRPMIPEGGFGA